MGKSKNYGAVPNVNPKTGELSGQFDIFIDEALMSDRRYGRVQQASAGHMLRLCKPLLLVN